MPRRLSSARGFSTKKEDDRHASARIWPDRGDHFARGDQGGASDRFRVHALVAHARPGDVLVLTSGDPTPVAFVGDLLATQAQARGVAGILVDAAVRDLDELAELGLPIWTRFVRAQGATKGEVGKLDVPVVVGGTKIRPGDLVVMDCDGAVVVSADRVDEVLPAAQERVAREAEVRERYRAGELSYDLQGLRALVEE